MRPTKTIDGLENSKNILAVVKEKSRVYYLFTLFHVSLRIKIFVIFVFRL